MPSNLNMRFVFAVLICLGFSSTATAQYPITVKLPVDGLHEPETTGDIFNFRVMLKTAQNFEVTYTPDTGPWPPDFSNPVSRLSSSGFINLSMGLLGFLDVILSHSDRYEYGGKLQILGSSQLEHHPGFKLSFLGFYSPAHTTTDSRSNGCILFCQPESRSWSITQSSERFAGILGYRFSEHFQIFGQYLHSRYRSDGTFNKRDDSIPATYNRSLNGAGTMDVAGLTLSYEIPAGNLRWNFELGATQSLVTSDAAPTAAQGVFHGAIGLWWDG
jgi:hypothetical protein